MANEYTQHWDEKFSSRSWGRYPPEDLVRFMGRNYKNLDRANVQVLEIGCGPGANLWFLHREGYAVSGIDCSAAAIEQANQRLVTENAGLNSVEADLRVGDFCSLPWEDSSFDVVVDIFALYANPVSVIKSVLNEVERVLKPGGAFYCKLWGQECTGFGEGKEIEPGTYDDIPRGPCKGMGLSHFFSKEEIEDLFGRFSSKGIDRILRTDSATDSMIEEFHCHFQKG